MAGSRGVSRFSRLGRSVLGVVLALPPAVAPGQRGPLVGVGADSVTIVAGAHYRAGGFHRFFVGGVYRDLWTAPIRVPVLDLRQGGGLRPKKEGGGMQTKSLRLIGPSGVEYVFRSVDKDAVTLPKEWKGTVVERVSFDQYARTYPGAAVLAAPLLQAAGVLQTAPAFVVMPDDSLLGEYRAEFAGRLGTIELFPTRPKTTPGFTAALDIIDSDTLLQLLNRDPAQRVDAPAVLAARLMDLFLSDWDRHPGQWKWAGFQSGGETIWEPIPRDRDFAFNGFSGLLAGLARMMSPNLARFDGAYPSLRGLTRGSLEFDRRLLNGLGKRAWDSVSGALTDRVTDGVIVDAVHGMPPAYQALAPTIAAVLRQRRDRLVEVAGRFYRLLAAVVDLHATDAADRAAITRVDDRFVDVCLESTDGRTYFRRRFDSQETREIRLYLHGGDDRALVTGRVSRSIPVRILGGNGVNRLIDSSTVDGRRDPTDLFDGAETEAVDTLFNRRPLMRQFGQLVSPGRDYGTELSPIVGAGADQDFGVTANVGITRSVYGFNHYPYSSRVTLEGQYSFRLGGAKLALTADERRANSRVHFAALARMSQLELVSFHGMGNATPGSPSDFFSVHQRQWLVQSAVAIATGPKTDLSVGPVFRYFGTDDVPNHFISANRPYGFGRSGGFGEAGVAIGLHRDDLEPTAPRHARRGMQLDLAGTFFPAVWGLTSSFGTISAATTVYLNLPVPTRPQLVLHGGGKKVFGTAPFQEAAFIGGTSSVRAMDLDRYAGDASIYSGAEFRVPVARFTLMVPLKLGLLASEDIGRVYVSGASPGGWHTTFGAGFWVACSDMSLDVRLVQVSDLQRAQVVMVRLVLP